VLGRRVLALGLALLAGGAAAGATRGRDAEAAKGGDKKPVPARRAWEAEGVGAASAALVVLGDGTVVGGAPLGAWSKKGKRLWQRAGGEGEGAPWLVELEGGVVAAGTTGAVVGLDAATGKEHWRAELPAPGDGRAITAGARAGKGLRVFAGGALWDVEPAACARGKACVDEVALAVVDAPRMLVVGDDGSTALADGGRVEVIDREGKTRALLALSLEARGVALLPNGRLVVNHGGEELLLVAPQKCRGTAAMRVDAPAGGKARGAAQACKGCEAPPSGCLVERKLRQGVEGPLEFGGEVVVTMPGRVERLTADLGPVWSTEMGARGAPVPGEGGGVVTACIIEETGAVGVCAVSGKGRLLWKSSTKVAVADEREGQPRERYAVATRGPWFVVRWAERLTTFKQ
jgi:hypothetical protein